MKLWREIKQEFLDALTKQLGKREAASQFKLLFESYTGLYNYHSLDLEKTVPHQQVKNITAQIKRLQAGEPIQYVLGYSWFNDLKLSVNEHVLIPRQETEELIHWVIDNYKSESPKQILDIGTGSGAIALALANHFPEATVLGVDVSMEALKVSEANCKALGLTNCSFKQWDILSKPQLEQSFDVIISNPPYITEEYAENMEQTVTDHEPHLALFVPNDDPLLFYRTIAEFAQTHLTANGRLFFEINEFFKDELTTMLYEKDFKHIETKKDLNGNWRMTLAMMN